MAMREALERLGTLIPGYTGYAERDTRRGNDKKLRTSICATLETCEGLLGEKLRIAGERGGRELLASLEQCRTRLLGVTARIQFAPYGASSFFSTEQIKSPELARIYELDQDIFLIAQTLSDSTTTGDPKAIRNQLDLLESAVERRSAFIAGVS